MSNLTVQKPKFELAIAGAKEKFLRVLPEERFIKEANFALQAIKKNSLLQKCDPQSIQNAIVNIAMTGATLNPVLQQAYLIPRNGECCLDFSYRGLIQLAVESGSVLDMDATVVHENDTFYWQKGTDPRIDHAPARGERGQMTHVYAVATLKSGIRKFVVLNHEDVEIIRQMSKQPNGLMWTKNIIEAWKKTAIKNLYKTVPQTEAMSTAVDASNDEFNLHPPTNAEKLMNKFQTPEATGRDSQAFSPVGEDQGQEAEPPETVNSGSEPAGESKETPAPDLNNEPYVKSAPSPPAPANLTEPQRKKIMALFNKTNLGRDEHGKPDRKARIAWVKEVIDPRIESVNDLTKAEAMQLIDLLEMAE